MKKYLLIIFLFTITLFGQGRFYPSGSDLKPKDPNWGVDVDHIKIKGLDLIPSISTKIDSIAERVDTLRNVKRIYLVNGVDTTEIYDNGDTLHIIPTGGRPIKLGNVVVDDISVQNIYVVSGGSSYLVEGQLGSDAFVVFDSTMTAQEIQDSINMLPKNLGGHDLTFQFSDGTYLLDTTLVFERFYGGRLYINGNLSESSTLYSTQSVVLNSSATTSAILIQYCMSYNVVRNIKVVGTSAENEILFLSNGTMNLVLNSYLSGGVSSSYGVRFQYSPGYIINSYVSTVTYGIAAYASRIYSNNNDDISTPPTYGLAATNGGTLSKGGGLQPTGSSSNEYTSTGGVIR